MKYTTNYFGEECPILEKTDINPVIKMQGNMPYINIYGVDIAVTNWDGALEEGATADTPAELVNNGSITLDDESIEALVDYINTHKIIAKLLVKNMVEAFDVKAKDYTMLYVSWNLNDAEPLLSQINFDYNRGSDIY